MSSGRRGAGGAAHCSRSNGLLATGPALLAALALVAGPARAHAPPLAARVLQAPGGQELIVTNRGLVFHEPATGSAELLCNEALRINPAELPNVAILSDGALLVASSSGLRRSDDRGCSWSDVGGMQTSNTPALAQDPSDPDLLFVARYDGDAPGLLLSRDAGASWTLALALDPDDYVRSLLIAPADPAHVYATVTRFASGQRPAHALLRSRDGGASWERLPLALLDTDNAVIAAASHPDQPETLLLYSVANSPGLDPARLLASSDAGARFEELSRFSEIRAASFASDGRIWVAARDGLYAAPPRSAVFEQLSAAVDLGCVQEREGALLVCGHYAGAATAASGVAVLDEPGAPLQRLLDFSSVDARVPCAADSLTEALCLGPWHDWQLEMLARVGGASPAGLSPAAGTSGSTAAPSAAGPTNPALDAAEPAPEAGCSLSSAGRARRATARAALLACALGLVRRRPRRPRC